MKDINVRLVTRMFTDQILTPTFSVISKYNIGNYLMKLSEFHNDFSSSCGEAPEFLKTTMYHQRMHNEVIPRKLIDARTDREIGSREEFTAA